MNQDFGLEQFNHPNREKLPHFSQRELLGLGDPLTEYSACIFPATEKMRSLGKAKVLAHCNRLLGNEFSDFEQLGLKEKGVPLVQHGVTMGVCNNVDLLDVEDQSRLVKWGMMNFERIFPCREYAVTEADDVLTLVSPEAINPVSFTATQMAFKNFEQSMLLVSQFGRSRDRKALLLAGQVYGFFDPSDPQTENRRRIVSRHIQDSEHQPLFIKQLLLPTSEVRPQEPMNLDSGRLTQLKRLQEGFLAVKQAMVAIHNEPMVHDDYLARRATTKSLDTASNEAMFTELTATHTARGLELESRKRGSLVMFQRDVADVLRSYFPVPQGVEWSGIRTLFNKEVRSGIIRAMAQFNGDYDDLAQGMRKAMSYTNTEHGQQQRVIFHPEYFFGSSVNSDEVASLEQATLFFYTACAVANGDLLESKDGQQAIAVFQNTVLPDLRTHHDVKTSIKRYEFAAWATGHGINFEQYAQEIEGITIPSLNGERGVVGLTSELFYEWRTESLLQAYYFSKMAKEYIFDPLDRLHQRSKAIHSFKEIGGMVGGVVAAVALTVCGGAMAEQYVTHGAINVGLWAGVGLSGISLLASTRFFAHALIPRVLGDYSHEDLGSVDFETNLEEDLRTLEELSKSPQFSRTRRKFLGRGVMMGLAAMVLSRVPTLWDEATNEIKDFINPPKPDIENDEANSPITPEINRRMIGYPETHTRPTGMEREPDPGEGFYYLWRPENAKNLMLFMVGQPGFVTRGGEEAYFRTGQTDVLWQEFVVEHDQLIEIDSTEELVSTVNELLAQGYMVRINDDPTDTFFEIPVETQTSTWWLPEKVIALRQTEQPTKMAYHPIRGMWIENGKAASYLVAYKPQNNLQVIEGQQLAHQVVKNLTDPMVNLIDHNRLSRGSDPFLDDAEYILNLANRIWEEWNTHTGDVRHILEFIRTAPALDLGIAYGYEAFVSSARDPTEQIDELLDHTKWVCSQSAYFNAVMATLVGADTFLLSGYIHDPSYGKGGFNNWRHALAGYLDSTSALRLHETTLPPEEFGIGRTQIYQDGVLVEDTFINPMLEVEENFDPLERLRLVEAEEQAVKEAEELQRKRIERGVVAGLAGLATIALFVGAKKGKEVTDHLQFQLEYAQNEFLDELSSRSPRITTALYSALWLGFDFYQADYETLGIHVFPTYQNEEVFVDSCAKRIIEDLSMFGDDRVGRLSERQEYIHRYGLLRATQKPLTGDVLAPDLFVDEKWLWREYWEDRVKNPEDISEKMKVFSTFLPKLKIALSQAMETDLKEMPEELRRDVRQAIELLEAFEMKMSE